MNKCQCLINQYICPSISSSSKLALCMPYHFAVILLCMFCALLSGNAGSSFYRDHEIDLLYRNQSHSGNCKPNQYYRLGLRKQFIFFFAIANDWFILLFLPLFICSRFSGGDKSLAGKCQIMVYI